LSLSKGHVDGFIGRYVSGWALPEPGTDHCVIEIRGNDGTHLAAGKARRDRADLAPLALGRIDFGFRIVLDNFGDSTTIHVLADGAELPGSPLQIGDGIVDGYFKILEDRVVGWACRRSDRTGPLDLTFRTTDGLAAHTVLAMPGLHDRDPAFQPSWFDSPLPDAFFSRADLHLEMLAAGRLCTSAAGSLPLRGFLDTITPDHCAGWLLCPTAPGRKLEIEALLDGVVIGSAVCALPRNDLRDAFPDSWDRGFWLKLTTPDRQPTNLSRLSLRLKDSTVELFNGPFVIGNRVAFVAAAKRVAALVHTGSTPLTPMDRAVFQTIIRDYLVQSRTGPDHLWRTDLVAAQPRPATPITVLIPIYAGIDITESCIRHVLADLGPADTLLLIADGPPEPGMLPMLNQFRAAPRVVILENETNLGFVRTVNRGLDYCKTGDVLLLNADTCVFPGTIDQMRRALHSADDIATVTALSNNATIFSYPHPTLATTSLPDIAWSELAGLARDLNRDQIIEVPTGHGFCLLIRREILDHVQQLNPVFGRGYGEENELCMRATDLGFRHVAATGALVEHRESVSFGAEKSGLISRNLAILGGMYPEYTPVIMAFEQNDPLRAGRWQLDIARLRRTRAANGQPGRRYALIVENHLIGGTRKAAADIGTIVSYGARHPIALRCQENGAIILTCHAPLIHAVFLPGDEPMLRAMLDAADIDLVLIHHLLGFTATAIQTLSNWAAHRKTFYYGHDFYPVCPRATFIDAANRFCGGGSPEVCNRCLTIGGSHEASRLTTLTIEDHRALFATLFANVTKIITPSHDTKSYLERIFPTVPITPIPHPVPGHAKPAAIRRGPSDNIILLGGIGPHKGSRQLREIARTARLSHPHLTFTIIGHTDIDDDLKSLPNVTILGRYTTETLPALIDRCGGRLALFLSCWPETFSYTLSEAVDAGLIPIVPNIGAPAERVRNANFGIIIPFPVDPADVLAAIDRFDPTHTYPETARAAFTDPDAVALLKAEFGP
jgi:GT2 family glycosyltransferase/glycosyltransferase involved in cell wall biosynthesis